MSTAADVSNLGQHLVTRASLGPDLEAVVDLDEGRRFTYREINERADRAAEALLGLGVAPGDRVGVLLPNGYRWVEVYYGAARAGIVVVPLNVRLVAAEVAFILRDAGAVALLSTATHADLVADLRERTDLPVRTWLRAVGDPAAGELDWDALVEGASGRPVQITGGGSDPAFLMYTSGTTGRPKGTVQTHDGLEWSLLTVVAAADMRYRDRYLISMPLFHIAAFNNLGTTLYKGGTVVLLKEFEPGRFWAALRDERIHITLAVPAMLNAMLAAYDPALHQPLELRWILSGASPIPASLIRTYGDLGFAIYQGYGLTEAGGVGCMIGPEDAIDHTGSTGKPFFHTRVRVVDADGNDCPPDVPGELLVRGKHVMDRYWNEPEETAVAIRDGWLHTGDIATWDADGFVYMVDRLKDMIISGGENIYPAEIESVLAGHPGIADIVVIGVPSERWGESPMALVVRADPALDEAAVLSYLDGRLARFKIPKAVRFLDGVPRNASGKALKRVLREQFATVAVG